MKKFSRLLLTSALLCLVIQNNCFADVIISFSNSGTSTNFDVQFGSTIEVPIYLSGDSRLSSQGLYSAGATVNYAYKSGTGNSGAGNASIASVQLDPHWTNALGNFTKIDNSSGNQVAILEGVVDGPPVVPVVPDFGTNYIKLGSVTFQSGAAGNVTALTLSTDLNLSFINLLYNSSLGVPLDGQLSFVGSTISTVSAVPEPSSIATVGLATVLFAFVRRRRALSPFAPRKLRAER